MDECLEGKFILIDHAREKEEGKKKKKKYSMNDLNINMYLDIEEYSSVSSSSLCPIIIYNKQRFLSTLR